VAIRYEKNAFDFKLFYTDHSMVRNCNYWIWWSSKT